jgi:HEAT repeat protein
MNPKEVTRLWEDLRHRDPEEKLRWLEQLAQNPTEDSIEILLTTLEQESWFLREQSSRVLASLGERVIEPLIEYLGSGLWYTRASAASALGRMGLPLAAAPLTRLLRDANRTVRDAAWDALRALARSEIGAYAVAEAFADLPQRAQRFALDGLLSRDGEIGEQISRMMEEVARRGEAEPGLRRAVNQSDELSWEDVVGRGGTGSGGD